MFFICFVIDASIFGANTVRNLSYNGYGNYFVDATLNHSTRTSSDDDWIRVNKKTRYSYKNTHRCDQKSASCCQTKTRFPFNFLYDTDDDESVINENEIDLNNESGDNHNEIDMDTNDDYDDSSRCLQYKNRNLNGKYLDDEGDEIPDISFDDEDVSYDSNTNDEYDGDSSRCLQHKNLNLNVMCVDDQGDEIPDISSNTRQNSFDDEDVSYDLNTNDEYDGGTSRCLQYKNLILNGMCVNDGGDEIPDISSNIRLNPFYDEDVSYDSKESHSKFDSLYYGDFEYSAGDIKSGNHRDEYDGDISELNNDNRDEDELKEVNYPDNYRVTNNGASVCCDVDESDTHMESESSSFNTDMDSFVESSDNDSDSDSSYSISNDSYSISNESANSVSILINFHNHFLLICICIS